MKKAKYLSAPFIYFIFISIMLIGVLFFLLFNEYILALVLFFMSLLFILPAIFGRKHLLSKMLIDDKGIHVYYRNKLLKEIKWEDIKIAKAIPTAYGGQIIFAPNQIYTKNEGLKNLKENFFINLNSDFALDLYEYKDKIPVDIIDLDKLNKIVYNKLKK